MEKRLEHWTADCTFARLAKLHEGMTVAFVTARVWEVVPNLPKVHLRHDGLMIGTIDIDKGTVETDNTRTYSLIRNLANRINEGKEYETCKRYMAAIETKYIEKEQKAIEQHQEVCKALKKIR